MRIDEYKNLISIRFPGLDTEKTEDGYKLSKIGLVEKVALEIFKEGRRSNSKIDIITRKKLIEHKKSGKVFFK